MPSLPSRRSVWLPRTRVIPGSSPARRRQVARRTQQPGGSLDWVRRFELFAVLITSLGVIGSLWYTNIQIEQTAADARSERALSREGQVTDRYNTAISNLGNTSLDVRLGGIYALQRIMQDSDRDQPTIVNVLCAYVRSHATPLKKGKKLPEKQASDVQGALDVLLARDARYDGTARVDLSTANLHRATLGDVDLHGAYLDGTDLSETNLGNANLKEAYLRDANLKNTYLRDANLKYAFLLGANLERAFLLDAYLPRANLTKANLQGADLTNANLQGAFPTEADLESADLINADLEGADLQGANLTNANLRGANLKGANLQGANLTNANLTNANLKGADLFGADLKGAKGVDW